MLSPLSPMSPSRTGSPLHDVLRDRANEIGVARLRKELKRSSREWRKEKNPALRRFKWCITKVYKQVETDAAIDRLLGDLGIDEPEKALAYAAGNEYDLMNVWDMVFGGMGGAVRAGADFFDEHGRDYDYGIASFGDDRDAAQEFADHMREEGFNVAGPFLGPDGWFCAIDVFGS